VRFLLIYINLRIRSGNAVGTTCDDAGHDPFRPSDLDFSEQYVYQEAEVENGGEGGDVIEPVWCWFLSYPHRTTQQAYEQYLANLRKTEKFDRKSFRRLLASQPIALPRHSE